LSQVVTKSGNVTSSHVRPPLSCGLRTPKSAFVFPILQAINELGGSASITEVMPVVERRMRGVLRGVDYEIFNQGRSRVEPRWRNTARWAKDAMVKLGFILDDSPRGLWELSDFGFEILELTR